MHLLRVYLGLTAGKDSSADANKREAFGLATAFEDSIMAACPACHHLRTRKGNGALEIATRRGQGPGLARQWVEASSSVIPDE
jgi:hypothetical protein